MKEFTPFGDIPSLGRLTVYAGEAENLTRESLQDFVNAVENKEITLRGPFPSISMPERALPNAAALPSDVLTIN